MAAAKASLSSGNPLRALQVSPYHAKYYAHEITRMAPGYDQERISMSLYDAKVDLNPHQIEAGLFALRSPLSKGVILADEVGLGKTIEAGLVLTQYWAERKRRLLIICPASIRKQWSGELLTKFNLPNQVLDASTAREAIKRGRNPFDAKNVLIVSYHFASKMKEEISKVIWDLVVIDEAHRLRNVHQKSAKTALNIKAALGDCKKLLLTATPLQNSLLELYGLASFVDDRMFGDKRSFQTQYTTSDGDLADLRRRLEPVVKRTLRRDVQEYINYTDRVPITLEFEPAVTEETLYHQVSEFIQRPDTYAMPQGQRHLMGMLLRKILASSSEALASTLTSIRNRLSAQLAGNQGTSELQDMLEDEVLEEEELEEMEEEAEEAAEPAPPIDEAKMRAEIAELDGFIQLARSVQVDSKSKALLRGLNLGFEKMKELGAQRKALVFTESRKTQNYLKMYLEANGYQGQIVVFNGTNGGPEQAAIFKAWLEANAETGRISGSKDVDMRTALIEYFRDTATIMLATESAAEGVNLQFCSLVINYDLPWNPQRIEQRIGRCHRYGQKNDVVVINFLNLKNHADQRVLELLGEKFNLFQGVFGSSDEVLGQVGSGVDFEKRIFEIYQECRTQEQINKAFDALQAEMDASIQARMAETRQMLLEHFDQEVHSRLRNFLDETEKTLDQFEQYFWLTTKVVLAGRADFDDENLTFRLRDPPTPEFKAGDYKLISKKLKQDDINGDFLYRLSHPLGEYVLEQAKGIQADAAIVSFNVSQHPSKISVLQPLKGKKGWLTVRKMTITAFEEEEHILFSGFDEDGEPVDPEILAKLLQVGTIEIKPMPAVPDHVTQELDLDFQALESATLNTVLEANQKHFDAEQDRIERWAADRLLSAQKELDEENDRIKEYARLARQATNMQERLELVKKQRGAESALQTHQRKIWDAQDEIRRARNGFIEDLEARLKQTSKTETLFTVAWKVV